MKKQQLEKQQEKSLDITKDLPILKHKSTILEKLNKNRVIVISGDTGCGKTTQVPKFILENGIYHN